MKDDANFLDSDVLTIGMGASGWSWTADIRLNGGQCKARRKRGDGPVETVEFDFDAEDLMRLQDTAADIYMEGDVEHREQFAQAGVDFRVVIDGEEVTASFGVEGALPLYDDIYSLVGRRVREA